MFLKFLRSHPQAPATFAKLTLPSHASQIGGSSARMPFPLSPSFIKSLFIVQTLMQSHTFHEAASFSS